MASKESSATSDLGQRSSDGRAELPGRRVFVEGKRFRGVPRGEGSSRHVAIDDSTGGDLASGPDPNIRGYGGGCSEENALLEAAAAVGDRVRRKHAEGGDTGVVARSRVQIEEDVIFEMGVRPNHGKGTDDAAFADPRRRGQIGGGMNDGYELRTAPGQTPGQGAAQARITQRDDETVFFLYRIGERVPDDVDTGRLADRTNFCRVVVEKAFDANAGIIPAGVMYVLEQFAPETACADDDHVHDGSPGCGCSGSSGSSTRIKRRTRCSRQIVKSTSR